MSILIGISGFAGSGKDTFASFLYEQFSKSSFYPVKYAFADPLKRSASILYGIHEKYFHDRDLKDTIHTLYNDTPRNLIIALADFARNIDKDIFIKHMLNEYQQYPYDTAFIVTDVRLMNEAKAIKENGGILVYVERDGIEKVNNHITEQKLPDNLFDFIVHNNGTFYDLKKKATSVVTDILNKVTQ